MGTFANAVNPSLNAKLPYDAQGAFAPVSLLARSFNLVVVNPASPIQSIADLVAAAKAEPGKLTTAPTAPAPRRTSRAKCSSTWPRSI
jgi:tripartite-type tricarboxylate transporter receptor subunit TctC